MDEMDLNSVVEELRKRKGIPKSSINKIGKWSLGEDAPPEIPELTEWAKSRSIEAVIWTALGPKFKNKDGQIPTVEEAIKYLKNFSGSTSDEAEKYIRRAPVQIDTDYRRRFEAELGWRTVNEK